MKKARSNRYPTETITEADDQVNFYFLVNVPAQAEFLLYSLQQAVGSISLNMNANKTELMSFKQKGTFSTVTDRSLGLVS